MNAAPSGVGRVPSLADLPPSRPPWWLIAATAALALGTLALAVAETSLWMHYLIDAGEAVSLVGLAFIGVAGVVLFRQRRLLVSLPLAVPWLLFPVITQGDQIIDNLSINWMRLITHVLLALLFGTPVAVVVLGVRYAFAPDGLFQTGRFARKRWLALLPGLKPIAEGRVREGAALLAAFLLVAEIWIAVRFLGLLMVATLMLLVWAVLSYGFARSGATDTAHQGRRRQSERFAAVVLGAGLFASAGLFLGFKNRPGAYQGSPSHFMDPRQPDAAFRLDRIAVPDRRSTPPPDADAARRVLGRYAQAFERLLSGYYLLDRNYNYDFHNHLFLRQTPLLPNYRAAGLARIREAVTSRHEADAAFAAVRPALEDEDPFAALLDETHAYAAFAFDRAAVLERMSAEFERTPAGLQHATHLYEGEGKFLGVQLKAILDKHRRVLDDPALAGVTAEFVASGRRVYDAYANRIVGF